MPIPCKRSTKMLSFLLVFVFLGQFSDNAIVPKKDCQKISEKMLQYILGAAYNNRYMSIERPITDPNDVQGNKRLVGNQLEFFLDNIYEAQLTDKPAWEISNHVPIGDTRRYRRDASHYKQEWHCKSTVIWRDLGPEYFPRYLRTVECMEENCWFGIYSCKPKSFGVKLLKKRTGLCVDIDDNDEKVGLVGLPNELRELWVWEEISVTFCCDCSL